MSLWKHKHRLIPLMALMALLLGGCGDPSISALDPKGPMAEEQLNVIKISLGVMILVIAVVFTIYIYVLIRFRRRPGDDAIPKQVEGSHTLEVIWTVIPILLLFIIAVPTIIYTFKHSKDYTNDPNAIQVEVTAHQFWWEFDYPKEGIKTSQELVIPVGKKVAFKLTSADVNHSFWVPSLGGKIDTNPGLTNIWHLEASEPGVYQGKCAELCGASHALMDFKVVAVSEEEYLQWTQKMSSAVQVPASAAKGQQIFRDNCLACHAVSADGGGLGPNLNGFADKQRIAGILAHTDVNLKEWIAGGQKVKPGNLMPEFGDRLDEAQLNDLVQYLNTLKH
jgi:cytochrome c oxidase subunit II